MGEAGSSDEEQTINLYKSMGLTGRPVAGIF
jgi:hypothetical protein